MKQPNFDPLLDDLLADSSYGDFRADLKQRALAEFRVQRRWRRIRIGAAVTSIVALTALALIWTWPRLMPQAPQLARERVAPPSENDSSLPASSPLRVETISNEQLVASFPPGSCFLAELDGQMVLVFHDPVLRDQVMR